MKVREMIEFLKLCDPDVQVCYPFWHTNALPEKAEARVVENVVQCKVPYKPVKGKRKQQVRVVVICPTITMVDNAEDVGWYTPERVAARKV